MQRNEIIDELITRKLFLEDDVIILADGFEDAMLGVTARKPTCAIYDFWKCLDITIKDEDMNFDEALEWLEEFIDEDLGEHAPIYLKKI